MSSKVQAVFPEKWNQLPESVRTDQQVAGIRAAACGATHSVMEKCNFGCTSCYLSDLANLAKPLPFRAITKQLDALREYLGQGGKVQITSGEVTLLPKEELGRIIAYAGEIGLDPMVMTNGQRLLDIPDYLPTLIGRYGLTRASFHIDTTSQGRPGMPLGLGEKNIHPIRDRFARLIRQFGDHRQIVEVVRKDKKWDRRVFRWALRELSPSLDFDLPLTVNLARLFGACLRLPLRLFELGAYSVYRLLGERQWLGSWVLQWLRLQPTEIHPLLIVLHKFMGTDELATSLGQERLRACVFKLPVDGRMVSMCEMNATSLRKELNLDRVSRQAAKTRSQSVKANRK